MNVEIWISAAAMLWLPGAALLRVSRAHINDGTTRVAVELALGLAFWPLIFLWTSFLPLQWTAWPVRALVVTAAAIAFFRSGRLRFVRHVTFHPAILAGIIAVTAWTRLRSIAGIVLPPWVDSVHHTMLVRLFLIRGGVPASYEPFIPGATAYYHWGYHAIAAALSWFTGIQDSFAVASLILSLGQFLNALAPLFVYSASLALVRSRNGALIAAALAGLVSYYPAYYVSWGRYTHLAGILLLLAWITVAVRIRNMAVAALIAAGLTLVHVRLAFFAVTFTVVLIAAKWLYRGRRRSFAFPGRARAPVLRLLGAAIIAAILLAPWFLQIRSVAGTALAPSPTDARWASPAAVQANLLWVPHTAELLSVATAGLSGLANIGPLSIAARVASFLWWLAILVRASRRRRAAPLLWTYSVLAAWSLITVLFLRWTHLQFATSTAAAITAFIPICIAAGALIGWVIAPLHGIAPHRIAVGIVIVVCALIGIVTLSNVINPATVIASTADVEALHWMRASLPQAAAVIGRVQPWYGGAFIGVDGAYWSSVLADRRSLPPPTLYGWSGDFGEMDLFLARWRDEYPFVTRNTMEEARKLGITHVYFGRRTPAEAPARLGRVVYARDGIAIAAITQ